jgi:glycosyltransferase involved in cell wall biosynthesis
MKRVSVVVPAYNEQDRIARTLESIRTNIPCDELIVVNDGSRDRTAWMAEPWADCVISHPVNRGKGAALETGWQRASGDVVLFLDADLEETAGRALPLLLPVIRDECDMSVAVLPAPRKKGGFGLAKGLARNGIRWLTGFESRAPLSGQRALKREVLQALGRLEKGFGIEVGLTIDVLRAGYRIMEVPVPFRHRETGNDTAGILHRGKEFWGISRALGRKWMEGWKR